jgi:hypothetical protein
MVSPGRPLDTCAHALPVAQAGGGAPVNAISHHFHPVAMALSPYPYYIAGFLAGLLVYLLGWSSIYPTLSAALLIFLFTSMILHLAAHWFWVKKFPFSFKKVKPVFHPVVMTVFIYLLWAIEFIYEGGIPLLLILSGKSYDYRLFGVPSLHVVVVTLSSFYTVFLFHVFVSYRQKWVLVLYLVNLAAAVLIYSRAMLFFNLAASFFIYLASPDKIQWKKVSLLIPAIIVLFYVFGVLGNLRVSFEAGEKYNSTLFLNTGQATGSFRQSVVPNEFFWSYIYISSPLANLQHNIRSSEPPPFTGRQLFGYVNNEILFDFISKRVNRVTGFAPAQEQRIPGPFNVTTIYSRSYSYLGWAGIFITALIVLALPFLYSLLLSPSNPYLATGLAILCTMFLFMVYDNTLRFTGLAFQLVYPIVFPVVEKMATQIMRPYAKAA